MEIENLFKIYWFLLNVLKLYNVQVLNYSWVFHGFKVVGKLELILSRSA